MKKLFSILFLLVTVISFGQIIAKEALKGSANVGAQAAPNRLSFLNYVGVDCAKFLLVKGDPEVSGGTRTELRMYEAYPPSLGEFWYSYSVFFSSTQFSKDVSPEIITQWHQGGGTSPSIGLIIKNGQMIFDVRSKVDVSTKTLIGDVAYDKWQRIVMHIIHSNLSDGLIEFWRDGIKLVTLKGPNSYAGSSFDLPRIKFGIYKWDWNNVSGTTPATQRVIYFSDVVIARKSTLPEMSGSAIETQSTPVPLPIPIQNKLPIVSAGADIIFTLPGTVTLSNATAADSDGIIKSVNWKFINGFCTISDAAALNPTLSAITPGFYTLEISATDDKGAIAASKINITVIAAPPPPPNKLPWANAGPDTTIFLPDTLVIVGKATDIDGMIKTMLWEKVSGGRCIITNPDKINAFISFQDTGTYTFRLTVTDDRDGKDTNEVTVTVLPAKDIYKAKLILFKNGFEISSKDIQF